MRPIDYHLNPASPATRHSRVRWRQLARVAALGIIMALGYLLIAWRLVEAYAA